MDSRNHEFLKRPTLDAVYGVGNESTDELNTALYEINNVAHAALTEPAKPIQQTLDVTGWPT